MLDRQRWRKTVRLSLRRTLEVCLCAVRDTVSQKQIGGMYYNLAFITQHPSDLSRPSALLQVQGEHVVMATQADQDPLAVIHSLAPQLQCVWAITQVGTNTHVAIYYLHEHTGAGVNTAVVLNMTANSSGG